jgi:hypothetical protein
MDANSDPRPVYEADVTVSRLNQVFRNDVKTSIGTIVEEIDSPESVCNTSAITLLSTLPEDRVMQIMHQEAFLALTLLKNTHSKDEIEAIRTNLFYACKPLPIITVDGVVEQGHQIRIIGKSLHPPPSTPSRLWRKWKRGMCWL